MKLSWVESSVLSWKEKRSLKLSLKYELVWFYDEWTTRARRRSRKLKGSPEVTEMIQTWYKACLGSGFTSLAWKIIHSSSISFLTAGWGSGKTSFSQCWVKATGKPGTHFHEWQHKGGLRWKGRKVHVWGSWVSVSVPVWTPYILLTSASVVLLESRFTIKIITRSRIETTTFSFCLQGRSTMHVQINSALVFSVCLLWSFLRLVAWWNRTHMGLS